MDWKSPDYLRYCWRDRSLCLLLCYSPVDVGGRCNNDIIIIINRNILNLNPQLLKRANQKNIVKIGEISRKVGLYHWITFVGLGIAVYSVNESLSLLSPIITILMMIKIHAIRTNNIGLLRIDLVCRV